MKRTVGALVAALAWVVALGPGASIARAETGLATHLVVHSSGDCPSGQAITRALWALRPDSEWPVLTAAIDVAAEQAQVTLDADQTHRRVIAMPPDCADRANRVALVIAVWSDELSAHATETPGPTVSVAMPAPAPAPPPARKSAVVAQAGLVGFSSMVGTWAPGAQVEVELLRRGGWWGVRAIAGYQSAKSIRVDIGASNYDRTLVGASFVLQWERPRLLLASAWGVVGALDKAHGDGYSENQSDSDLNIGLVANGRVGTRFGRWRTWADLSLYRWARKETMQVDPLVAGAPTAYTLPTWDAHAGLGVGVVFD